MKLTFFETPAFSRYLNTYLDDDEYRGLQNALLEDPAKGAVIQGTGGFRKMRWENSRRGKGKRGGLRIIYYLFMETHEIWFFTLYDKDEETDLNPQQKRAMHQAIQAEKHARANQ